MSAFLNACILRVVDDSGPRPIIELVEPLHYASDLAQMTVSIPERFVFDGASVPTPGMGVIGWPGLRAACVHDWMCRTQPDRGLADEVFREALMVCGVDRTTADIMYAAVALYSDAIQPREPDLRVGA